MASPMMTLLTLSAAILLSAARCSSQGEETYDEPRRRMVEEQLRARDIEDPRVLAAMGRVPRHLFVPAALRFRATPIILFHRKLDKTISQPYIVALMTQLAEASRRRGARDRDRLRYQAAVLSRSRERSIPSRSCPTSPTPPGRGSPRARLRT
jgi:hypothetical protein